MQFTLTTNAEMTWISEKNSASFYIFFSFGAISNWSHIEKDRKRVKQSLAQEESQAEALDTNQAALKEALQVIRGEEGPKTMEEKEGYFMTQVGIGEQLQTQGP